MIELFIFIFGICLGSFLNAFLYRYQNKITLSGRSICPKCKKQIMWFDNIPLLSWLILRGRCRNCKKPISVQYPLVEFLAGLIVLLIAQKSGFLSMFKDYLFNLQSFDYLKLIMFLILSVLFLVLLLISFHDIKTQEIPNGFNAAFIASSALYLVISWSNGLVHGLWFLVTAIVAFLFFFGHLSIFQRKPGWAAVMLS